MSTIEKVMQRLQKSADNERSKADAQPNVDKKSPVDSRKPSSPFVAKPSRLKVVEKPAKMDSLQQGFDEKYNRIQLESLDLQHFLNPNDPDHQILEEYRRIKRPLVINVLEREGPMAIDRANLIMVTSSLPGEGKTYSAANLALSISMEKDISVLLIDCDVHKKSLSKVFHSEDRPGILEYLDQPLMDLSEVMIDTDVPNLAFVPAGHWRRDSAELLAGQRMLDMTREISERYDDRIVIFDSPPLLSCNDSAVLGRFVGQIVMVIEEGSTTSSKLNEALSRLPDDKFVGMIFNKASKSDGDGAGYHGDYYGSEPVITDS